MGDSRFFRLSAAGAGCCRATIRDRCLDPSAQRARRPRIRRRAPAAWLPEAADTLELGLCMVVEERTARAAGDEDLPTHSYWALWHTGERPDFTCRDSFALSLPAISRERAP